MRILLVEDDDLLTQVLTNHLRAQHYVVDVASDGVAGFDYAQAVPYDLIVLDVNLPRLDGIRLCQQLRQHRYTVPILLLTAKGNSSDKVMGLDAGADDYVVKPCSIEEISARIRALLRRSSMVGSPILSWGNLNLDPVTCEVTCYGQLLSLSPKEYSLLELLLRHPQRTFSSGSILEHLWSFEDAPGEETIRSHIKRLRRKLKAAGMEEMIDTVYGMGYRLKAPLTSTESAVPEEVVVSTGVGLPIVQSTPVNAESEMAAVELAAANSPEAQARLAALSLWEQFKQPILERVSVLEQAVVALDLGTLTDDLREAAAHAAHKLAGSLAMFGFPAGTELARDLEAFFNARPIPTQVSQIKHRVAQLAELLQQPIPPSASPFAEEEPPIRHRPHPQVLVIDADSQFVQALQTPEVEARIGIQGAPTIAAAKLQITQKMPDVILLDGTFLAHKADTELLTHLIDQVPKPCLVVISEADTFPVRLAGVRMGCDRFVLKSTLLENILDIVQELMTQHDSTTVKVLAVDDDPIILDRLNRCLPNWGIQLMTLSTPDTLWQTLVTTQPDLVILDVEMPLVNGLELCRVIRGDRTWGHLPILFLTARREPQMILQMFEAGADDYVSKPFTELELVTRIFNRLARNCLSQPI